MKKLQVNKDRKGKASVKNKTFHIYLCLSETKGMID